MSAEMNEMVFTAVQNAIDDDMNMWHHDAMLWAEQIDRNAANTLDTNASAANAMLLRYQDIQRRQSKLDMYRTRR